MHSFTRQLRGREPRPWHVGVLHTPDERFSRPLINRLKAEDNLCVGVNEPYTGVLPGDAIDTHCTSHGRPNALIELRNDLIADHAGQRAWAERLAVILQDALSDSGL
jgi:predicted N-formylglutamate amidohydrolase